MRNQITHRTGTVTRARLSGLTPAPLATAALAMLASIGCQHQPTDQGYAGSRTIGAEIFTQDDEDAHVVDRFTQVQLISAARTDATLRPYHFNGAELNSLGQQKLDLMAQADRGDLPLQVYLDLQDDTGEEGARREAVVVYLKDHGFKDEQFKLVPGPNLSPENLHPAAQSMRMMHLLDAGAPVGQNPEPSNSAAAAPPH